MRSFSSLEDLMDNEHYEVELAPQSPDELPGPQESEQAEVSTADHHSEIPEITVNSAPIGDEEELTTEGHEIEPGDQVEGSPQDETIMDVDFDAELTTEGHEIEPGDQAEASPQDKTIIGVDYDADNESDNDGELNKTVVAAQGAQPSVVGAVTIETMHIVHPNGQLNQPVAETSDEVLQIMEEQVPYTNLPPEAIVNEVEAVQVAAPVEPNGAYSIVSCPNI